MSRSTFAMALLATSLIAGTSWAQSVSLSNMNSTINRLYDKITILNNAVHNPAGIVTDEDITQLKALQKLMKDELNTARIPSLHPNSHQFFLADRKINEIIEARESAIKRLAKDEQLKAAHEQRRDAEIQANFNSGHAGAYAQGQAAANEAAIREREKTPQQRNQDQLGHMMYLFGYAQKCGERRLAFTQDDVAKFQAHIKSFIDSDPTLTREVVDKAWNGAQTMMGFLSTNPYQFAQECNGAKNEVTLRYPAARTANPF